MLTRPLRSFVSSSLVLVACVAGPGCSDDPPAKPADADELDYELWASTRELRAADLEALTSSDDVGTLAFSSEPPALAGIDVGQVLLAPASEKAPAGLLRVVTGVERDTSSALVLRTAAAPPQLAFKRLHARMRRTAEPNDPSLPFTVADTTPLSFGPASSVRPRFSLVKGKGEGSQTYEIVVYDGDGDVGTVNDQIKIDATLGGGFGYELSIDFDWGILDGLPELVTDCITSLAKIVTGEKPSCSLDALVPEAKTTFAVTPFVNLDVTARGAATLAYEKELEVGTIPLPIIPLGPLVFVPTVDIVAKVEGGASARFEVGASARAELESFVTVSSKHANPQYSPLRLKDHEVKAKEPVVDLHASAKAQVGARLNVSLYGVVGPYATVSGVAQIDAAPLESPCWKLRFALEGDLGVRITSPRLPIIGYVTIADFRSQPFRPFDEEVATGSCLVPPDPPLPPGGGPTATTYQSPTFAPWAKQLGGSVDGIFSHTGTFLLAAPELERSIDGRYLAAGQFAFGLHKIDDTGALTWTSSLAEPGRSPLRARRSVPTHDAAIMTLLVPEDTTAFALAKSGQSGALAWARSYALQAECIPRVSHLLRDGGTGYLVLGHCAGGLGWIVHVDERGEVVRARTMREQGSRSVEPVAGVTSGGEIVIAGQVAREGELEQTFVTRLDAEDRPTVSTVFHCPERIVMQPSAMIPAEDGGVTVVGAANGPGYVARVRRDGALGFARLPNLGVGAASDLIVSSVAELPTTGMVVAGSMRDVSEGAPPFVVLAGLDSGGSTLWSRGYAITAPAPRALAVPAIRLTDDGGILVTAVAGPAGGREGDLFAMKVHAKDGNLGEGSPVTSTPVALGDHACVMATRAFAPEVSDVPVTTAAFALERR